MNAHRGIIGSLSWNYAGRIADSAGLYLVNLCIARAVGVADYGRYALILSGLQLTMALGSFGLEASLNRFLPVVSSAQGDGPVGFIVRRTAALRGTAAALFAGVVFSLAGVETAMNGLPVPLVLFTVFAMGRSLVPLVAVSMVARLETRRPALIGMVIRGIELCGAVVLWSSDARLSGFVILLATTSAVHATCLLIFSEPSLRGPEVSSRLAPILAFGAVYSVNVLVDFFLGRFGDVVLLGSLAGDPRQTGLYEVGAGLVHAAGLIMTTGFAGIGLAVFSEIAANEQGSHERLGSLYSTMVRALSFLTLPVFVYLVIDARTLVVVLFSERFEDAVPIVRALALLRIAGRLFGGGENTEALLALGRVRTVSLLGIAAAGLNIAGDLALIPRWGASGAVAGTALGYVVVTMATFYALRLRVRISLQVRSYVRILGGCAMGALGVVICPPLQGVPGLVLHVVVFAVLSAGAWLLVRPVEDRDRALLERFSPALGSVLARFSRNR
jgi:O-antigen/teichoic acid export membrane protein